MLFEVFYFLDGFGGAVVVVCGGLDDFAAVVDDVVGADDLVCGVLVGFD